ncbi:HNH endonuclease [Paraburkholderia sp. A2WS-5]|uniref:HNH endonuclease n=1 Tax=unclassified Paraburkholderia TaxID=2615204 RepID=UPI003B7BFFF3
MNTYLLTWNPKRWNWDLASDLAILKAHGFFEDRWSCGHTRRIKPGDRLFLLRQGVEPRGIVASGQAKSSPHADAHWDVAREDKALYVYVRFDTLLDPTKNEILPLDQLQNGPLAAVNWRTQSSGISIEPTAALQLEGLWSAHLQAHGQAPAMTPDEILTPALYFEGASRTVNVNAYERDPRARKACIDHYGTKCSVCGFDFAVVYGPLGRGYIHVHHVVPLSSIGERYAIDPIRDLRPVCPNCHAMLHRGSEVLPIDDLREMVNNASGHS